MTQTITISPVDGNNHINKSNASGGITITGTATNTLVPSDLTGQTVTVTLNGKTYTGTVSSTGTWSVSIGSADLGVLTDGNAYTVGASVTDKTSTTSTTSDNVTVDKTLTLTMPNVDGSNYISIANAANGIFVTGSANGSAGLSDVSQQTATLIFNGKTYTALVNSLGNFVIPVPAADLASLTDGGKYLAQVTLIDKAGNTAVAAHTITVAENVTISMNTVDGNDYINGTNAASGITVSGTTSSSAGLIDLTGRTVSVTLGGKLYKGKIASDDSWSVSISASDLALLKDGAPYSLTAYGSDYAGNPLKVAQTVVVDKTVTLAINPVDGNNYVNAQNAAASINIAGTATGSTGNSDTAGQTVTVTFNGKTYTTAAGGGQWTVNIPHADVLALADGATYTATASITDKGGNTQTGTGNVTVDKTATLTMNPVDGNNYINAENISSTGITVNGTATDSLGTSGVAGQGIEVTFGGAIYANGTNASNTGTIASNGTWSVNIPASELGYLLDTAGYTVSASFTDVAGNHAYASQGVSIDKTASLAINPVDGSNIITASNIASGITISGTANDSFGWTGVAGATITVTFNGQTYTGTVSNSGNDNGAPWSVNVGTAVLAALTDGASYTIIASGTDIGGNALSATDTVTVYETVVNWGSNSGDWGTATNWQGGVLPGVNDLAEINLTSGETVTYSTGDSSSQVSGITLFGSGTLDLSGGTLTVFNALNIQGGTLELDSGATLQNATITNTGGTLDFNSGTLDNVTYDGTIDMSETNASVYVANGLTLNGSNGTGAGAINLTGNGSFMYFEGTQTLDNATITLGNVTHDAYTLDDYILNHDTNGTASVLTLGSNLAINNVGDSILGSSPDYAAGDGIVNKGTINVEGTNSWLYHISNGGESFINAGTINADSGATVIIDPLQSNNFSNSGTLNANGGTINVDVAETGNGNATISGNGTITYQNAVTDNVTFESGSTGTLVLDTTSFSGNITGFTGAGTAATSDKIDLKAVNFATLSDSYSGNVLTVGDGTHSIQLHFIGSYSLANFHFQDDGSGGTLVYDPPVAASSSANTEASYQKLVQGMASFSGNADSGAFTCSSVPYMTLPNVAIPVHTHH